MCLLDDQGRLFGWVFGNLFDLFVLLSFCCVIAGGVFLCRKHKYKKEVEEQVLLENVCPECPKCPECPECNQTEREIIQKWILKKYM